MTRTTRCGAVVVVAGVLLAACNDRGDRFFSEHAFADLYDRQGTKVGDLTLEQLGGRTDAKADLYLLPRGEYVLELHDRAECHPPFESAGVRVSLGEGTERGSVRFIVGDSGGAKFHFRSSLQVGSLFGWDGSSFVLTPAQATDVRYACGTVKH